MLTLLAGHFGTESVAAFACTLNAVGVFARFPLGISFSVAVLVGHKLGNAQPKHAKTLYDCGLALSSLIGLISGALLWLCAEPISKGLFTFSFSALSSFHFVSVFIILSVHEFAVGATHHRRRAAVLRHLFGAVRV